MLVHHGPVIAGVGIVLQAATLFASPLELGGDSECPTIGEIARHLEAMPPSEGPSAPAFVQVSSVEGRVRLELHGANGKVLASRDLDAAATCDDLAAAAAVVVATWQNDLDPKASLPVELPAAPPAPAPAPAVVAVVEPPPPPRPRGVLVGLGLLASAAEGAIAPGAKLRASVDVGPSWLSAGAVAGGTTSRAADVGDRAGAATWTRGWLGAGPEIHAGFAPRVEAHLLGLVGVLHVAGVDLPQASSDTMFDLGVGGGVSIVNWVGNAAVWLGVDLLTWPGRQRLIIQGLPDEGLLPTMDLQLSAGIALGRNP
jgi:hypothetical protein